MALLRSVSASLAELRRVPPQRQRKAESVKRPRHREGVGKKSVFSLIYYLAWRLKRKLFVVGLYDRTIKDNRPYQVMS